MKRTLKQIEKLLEAKKTERRILNLQISALYKEYGKVVLANAPKGTTLYNPGDMRSKQEKQAINIDFLRPAQTGLTKDFQEAGDWEDQKPVIIPPEDIIL